MSPMNMYPNALSEPGQRSSEEIQYWNASTGWEASKGLSIRLSCSPRLQGMCRGCHYPWYLHWREDRRSWNCWRVWNLSYPLPSLLIPLVPRSEEVRENRYICTWLMKISSIPVKLGEHHLLCLQTVGGVEPSRKPNFPKVSTNAIKPKKVS
jgi:hypothetical protein